MTLYQEFLERKQYELLAEYCYDNEIDPQQFLDKAYEYLETKNEQVYSELMQGFGNMVGNAMAGMQRGMGQAAVGAGKGIANFASGVKQGYMGTQQPTPQNQVDPNQRAKAVKYLSNIFQQLGKAIPQITQQLQIIQ